jgi:tetratricopeptide (TPR) repeat protein
LITVKALSCFKRALYLNPLEWGLYYNLGLVYLAIKVYSVAFHYFLTSIKYNPQNAEAYMLLGVCLNKLQDPANAFNAFEKACTIDPKNHMIFLNMAIFLAEHSRDSTNARLAKEKFLKHDELYARTGGLRDPAVEAQRSALRSMLQLDSP